MTAHGMTVYFRKVGITYSKPIIFQLWISKIHRYTVTASCHGTKDGSACEPFCCCIMSGADHIVLMPIAVDCLIKWAEIPALSYLWDQLRSPSIWKLTGSFFPWEMFWEWLKSKNNLLYNGTRLNIHRFHKALLNVSPSVLNFSSLY